MKVPSHSSCSWWLLLLPFVCLYLTSVQATAGATTSDSPSSGVCTVKGRVFTQRNWYGYIVHKAFHRDYAKIQYQITYPVKECCTSLLIYYDEQVKQLRSSMTCEQRLAVLPADNNQVIQLRALNESSGCTLWNETGEAFYVCLGERIFRSSVPRTWFFAISRCGYSGPLNLNYVFNITGYIGDCEDDPLAPSSGWNSYVGSLDHQVSSSSEDVYKYLSISLGIVAGLGLISAAVFFGLWFMGMKNAAKAKGSSVTSSQATMTQDDIFYVNPSLSEREQVEYSQSGSENYYEVIPERRSYESINTGLANGGLHLRQLRSPHGSLVHHPHAHHHSHNHPHHAHHAHMAQPKDGNNLRAVTYMFEDYPPPPYQPPRILGIPKNTSMVPNSGHTVSLPANRQRPTIIHHAYHSSLVPTSAALGNVSSGGPATSGMNSGILSMNNSNSPGISSGNNFMLNNLAGIQSFPTSMATFGGAAASHVASSGAAGINMTSLANHQLLSSIMPHSSASNNLSLNPVSQSSMATSLGSIGFHKSVPLNGGQSETSA